MTARALTDFEQVLLGTIVERPRSGYELKKHFTGTPPNVYQPSPGALYPALRRLEQRGLLRAEQSVSAGRRLRRVYHASPAGQQAHLDWVRQPLQAETVARDLSTHLMRFAMMEHVLPRSEVVSYLAALASALDRFVEGLERSIASTPLSGYHPRLALEHGLQVHRASLEWAHEAIRALCTDEARELAT